MARQAFRGFTLIELLVALAIGTLLILLGMPSFTTFLRNSEIRSTAESLVNGLRLARTEAANRNTPVTFTLNGIGPGWTGWDVTYVDVDDANRVKTIQEYFKNETGANTNVTVPPPGAQTVVFSSLGRIQSTSLNDRIGTILIDSIVSGEARPLQIIVGDGTRGIRLCDPGLDASIDPRGC